MHKVNVSVPAVSTNVGPGFDALGLALNLRNVVEMSLTPDDALAVEVRGEGEGVLPASVHNPAIRAAIRLFQSLEQAPTGLAVRCTNRIPLDVGLSARAALIVGGVVAANNLLGNPYTHDDLIRLAAEFSGQPEAVATAMRGGLSLCSSSDEGLVYRAIEVAPLRVVLAVPELAAPVHRLRDALPQAVPLDEVVTNIGHALLLVEALRQADYKLLRLVVTDRLHEPYRTPLIPGYAAARAAALAAGAVAVTLCGAGPALLAFAPFNHPTIEAALRTAFQDAGIAARTWTVGVDLQGVVISVVE